MWPSQAGSLKFVPADAGFYSCTLRAGEQLQAVTKSKAWAKIKDMPAFKLAWQAVQDEYSKDEGKLAGLRRFYEQEENKDLVALIRDAFSEAKREERRGAHVEVVGEMGRAVQVQEQLALRPLEQSETHHQRPPYLRKTDGFRSAQPILHSKCPSSSSANRGTRRRDFADGTFRWS